jgi:hypothetical protein
MAQAGRNSRKTHVAEIEQEYGKSLRQVIEELRAAGHNWMTVAVMLDICEPTLIVWRKSLGMEINGAKRQRTVR